MFAYQMGKDNRHNSWGMQKYTDIVISDLKDILRKSYYNFIFVYLSIFY